MPVHATSHRLAAAAAALVLVPVLLGGCGGSGDDEATASGPVRSIAVESTDTECLLDAVRAPAGQVAFAVRNTGGAVAAFSLRRSDGSVVIEVEDIGPGLSADLQVDLPEGDYVARCTPGMRGDGIDVDVTVEPA